MLKNNFLMKGYRKTYLMRLRKLGYLKKSIRKKFKAKKRSKIHFTDISKIYLKM